MSIRFFHSKYYNDFMLNATEQEKITSEVRKPVVLVILDGWGFSKKTLGNPIANAQKPTMDAITSQYPMTLLQASGLAVGMTWGESGNSEVGHLNIGAGRIVEQYLSRINRAIKDGSFYNNPSLSGAFDHAIKNKSKIHLIGLLTSGTAHADFSHIIALLEIAKQKQYQEVYLHLFLDGKDSGLQEAPILLAKLQTEITSKGYGKLATLIGRNFPMDRDNNWDLIRKAYELLVETKGEISDDHIISIQKNYSSGLTDSSMPAIILNNSKFNGIGNNDALLFFNFREDSMRQILKPFIDANFSLFPIKKLEGIYLSTMTQYLESPNVKVAFNPPVVKNNLAEVLEHAKKRQLRVAETE
ncbi:MAG: 2,3-bisphosphoglycerate-independent phosphoglycerate mutase, partial [Patescibacteria group bacterium]